MDFLSGGSGGLSTSTSSGQNWGSNHIVNGGNSNYLLLAVAALGLALILKK